MRRSTLYPESVTPNLHALARTYALADNFYASDADVDVAQAVRDRRRMRRSISSSSRPPARRARPMNDRGDDPEDYARAGYLFNAMARAGLTFRDYGGLLRLSGYDGSAVSSRRSGTRCPRRQRRSGVRQADREPVARASAQPDVDGARADEFVRDMQRYVDADRMPSFTYVRAAGDPGPRERPRDADRALGTIVDYISHTPHWSSTAVFIVPEGAVGAHRSRQRDAQLRAGRFAARRGAATSATRT